MITQLAASRLMQYHQGAKVRGSAAAPAGFAPDSFLRTASLPAQTGRPSALALPALQSRPSADVQQELAAIRKALEAILRLLEAQAAQPKESNTAYVTGLYRELLGREPDAEGLASHVKGLETGMSREDIRQVFLNSPEYAEKQRKAAEPPAPAPAPTPAAPPKPQLPAGALPGLPSVPVTEEFANAPIDKSSVHAALLSAATWVKATYPQLFTQGDDRALAYKMMTKVIGVLRAHGYDAHRIVNHPSLPMDNPVRYGSDALVLNGIVYDVYGSLGEANRPQVLEHGPMSGQQQQE